MKMSLVELKRQTALCYDSGANRREANLRALLGVASAALCRQIPNQLLHQGQVGAMALESTFH